MRRYAYLDHIRWMTVLLVIVYHVCYLFNGVGILGGVPNARNLPFLDTISGTVYPWFMVLLFVVAGMCARFALVQQGNRAFLRNRARKLLVPSTLGLFVLHWVTGYLNIRMGGAMDIVSGAKKVIIAMEHCTKNGDAKIVEHCSLPLTAPGCVNTIVTELCIIDCKPGCLTVTAIAPGVTPDEIRAKTGAHLCFAAQLETMLSE